MSVPSIFLVDLKIFAIERVMFYSWTFK